MKTFPIYLAGIALIVGCVFSAALHSESTAGQEQEPIENYQTKGWHISSPMTVEEIEQSFMEKLKEYQKSPTARKDIPMVPFAFANDKWTEFKSKVRKGDEIRQLSTPKEYWERLAGWEGYILVRQGFIVWKIMTRIN
jgi:hypothetical protein